MDAVVTMTGNVGSDVELKTTRNGASWAVFRLACTPRTRRAGEWTDDGTIWISVQCWRGLAENAKASLMKGDPVIVTGRLRLDSWLTKDGEVRESKVIEATAIGPDLSHGTATFRRVRRSAPVLEEPAVAEVEANVATDGREAGPAAGVSAVADPTRDPGARAA